MKTIKEIRDALGEVNVTAPGMTQITLCVDELAERLGKLEATLERAERAAYRAAEVAGCLANGIKPD